MKGWYRCAICDEWYDPNGERAKIHDHPEPQSGFFRDAWLASKLPYETWRETTEIGKAWKDNHEK